MLMRNITHLVVILAVVAAQNLHRLRRVHDRARRVIVRRKLLLVDDIDRKDHLEDNNTMERKLQVSGDYHSLCYANDCHSLRYANVDARVLLQPTRLAVAEEQD